MNQVFKKTQSQLYGENPTSFGKVICIFSAPIAEFSVDCNHIGLELPVLEDMDLPHTGYFRNNTHSSKEITFQSVVLEVPIYSTTTSIVGNP